MPTDTELPARGAARQRDTHSNDVADAHADAGAARRDVDLGSVWSRVLGLWWLVLLVAVVVAAVSLRGSNSTPQRYQASATVYLGQPVTPGGALLNTVTSKATTAIEIATSDVAVRKAAEAAGRGTTPATVRAGLSVVSVTSVVTSKLLNPPTLLRVSSKLKTAAAANAAATAVAGYLVDQTNGYFDARQAGLKQKVANLQAAVADLQAQRAIAVRGAARASGDASGATFGLTLVTISNDLRLTQADLDDALAQMATSKELERSYVVTKPSATKVTVAGGRSSLAVSIFLGLVAGIAVALVASLAGLGRGRRRPA